MALDQGTGSSRTIIFNKQQQIVGIEQQEFKQFYPKPNEVEQNPHEIWENQYLTAKTLITRLKINPAEIAGIGITNQRETTIIWDKYTGEPIYNAIVWQDKRTLNICNSLKANGFEKYIKEQTGLIIDSYFSATKIHWILKNIEGAEEKAKNGELLFGTVDTWLVWKLSGGKIHITDYSNASRTMIFNINTHNWDKTLLKLLEIPENILPTVMPSSEIYGVTATELFGHPIPIAGIAGDQQAALFGQKCFQKGNAKNTYGTGCFMLMNTGEKPVFSKTGLLSTIAWNINGKTTYALEGSVFIAGAVIKWLRDGLKLPFQASETEEMIKKTNSNEGVYFVPAFSGLGAPYWNMNSKGLICGLTLGVNQNHIVRAAVESLAYQTKDILDAMILDSEINLTRLNVDGGASVNNFLMQFQADILNIPVSRPKNTESTALGTAFLAGLSTGFWTEEMILQEEPNQDLFVPEMDAIERTRLYKAWISAVKKCLSDE